MTIQQDWVEQGRDYEEHGVNAADWSEPQPIPVKVARDENEQISPEFANCMTWPVTTFANTPIKPTQICPHRYHRYKAKLWCIPGTGATGVILNSKPDALMQPNPQGATFTFPASPVPFALPEYDAQRPLYAMAIGGPVTISVIDEAYGTVQ